MPDEDSDHPNVQLVKEGFAALKQEGVDGLLSMIDPEFEVTTPPDLASEPDTYRGHDGLRRYFDSFYEAMDDVYFEGRRFEPIGEQVLVDFTLHARGKTTGIEAEQSAFMLWTIRDGKATVLDLFTARDDALAAARGDGSS